MNHRVALVVVLAAFGLASPTSAHDTRDKQWVEIGPFSDGTVVWCRGREDDGKLVISVADSRSCRMDTTYTRDIW